MRVGFPEEGVGDLVLRGLGIRGGRPASSRASPERLSAAPPPPGASLRRARARPQAAYAKIERKYEGGITADKVSEILEVVYHGPAPETDMLRIGSKLTECESAETPVPMGMFLGAIADAKADEDNWESTQKNIVSEGSEFASSKFYRDHITRHTRMDKNPNEKYHKPVTANMEIGWSPPESYSAPRAAKKSCEETVYAAELIKAGVYY